MRKNAVFFDRDNTLIACDGYLGDPAQVKLVNDAPEAIARLRGLGFATVVFSNQSGVARGLYDESAVQAVNARMEELLLASNPRAIIDRHEYCPFHPEGTVEKYRQESELRKPRAGMIHRAHQAMDLNLHRSWVIGDALRDVEAGRVAGCRTILCQNPSLAPAAPSDFKGPVRADYTCTSLEEAVNFIEQAIREESRSREDSSAVIAPPPPTPEPQPVTAPVIDEPKIPPPPPPPSLPPGSERLETLAGQILQELKRRNEREHLDFSVGKLLAGIVQVLVIAVLFVGYLNYQNTSDLQSLLMLATVLQTLVVALLLISHRS